MRKQSRIDLVSVSLKQQTTHRMEEQIIEPAELTQIRPSKRQLQWQQLEFYGSLSIRTDELRKIKSGSE
ncbi:hypothetical protein [Enterococcus sp. DIV0765a]|uniref:hypothetical protein n=1 Tax=Enterococcus sp. DIV0765a TaxID=2774828 RepID=UPI003D2B7B31